MSPSRRHRLLNLAHTALLLLGMGAVAWATAAAIAGGTVALGIAVGLVVLLGLASTAPKRALLAAYRARRLDGRTCPDGVRLLKGLADRADLPREPALYWVPSSVPNAFAMGSPADSVICVTDGLLRLMDRREVAGVLAHEVAHIAHRDLRLMALADVMTRTTALVSTAGQILLLINLPLVLLGQVAVPWTTVLTLVFAPTVMSLLQLALSRAREVDADLGAAQLTADPLGLASALLKLERRRGAFWEEILLPGRRTPEPSMLRSHPPTAERVARLREIAGRQGQQPPAPPSDRRPARILPGPGMAPVRRRPRLRWSGVWY